MAASAVLRRQLARDSCVLAASPLVRLALVQATHATEAGRQQWGLTNAHASRLLGRAMVATALLAAPLEGEERVTMQFTAPHGAGTGADSPVASLRAEASAHGELRAFIAGSAVPAAADVVVANRPVIQAGRIISALALAPLPMSPALAHWNGRFPRDSVLTVSRILYNRTEAATSSVSIGGDEGGRSAGNVESDLAHLFEVSDQVASAVKLDVCTDAATDAADAGRLTYAGGVVGQRIATTGGKATPSAHEWASFEQVADRVTAMELSREHARGVTLHAVAHRLLLRDAPSVEAALAMPAFPATPLDLFCRCSKPAFLRNLVAAGGRQLVAELLAEHRAAAATVDAADAERTVASTGADGGTVVHRVHDVATTLSCGTCNRRHYITAADLSAVSL